MSELADLRAAFAAFAVGSAASMTRRTADGRRGYATRRDEPTTGE
jgi:hypothetical protein